MVKAQRPACFDVAALALSFKKACSVGTQEQYHQVQSRLEPPEEQNKNDSAPSREDLDLLLIRAHERKVLQRIKAENHHRLQAAQREKARLDLLEKLIKISLASSKI